MKVVVVECESDNKNGNGLVQLGLIFLVFGEVQQNMAARGIMRGFKKNNNK